MTRREAPISPPVVLTIAGSDSGGGAGIQADLKTIEACGGFGTSAITSVTAQNTVGVQGSHLLPTADIEAQIESVTADFDVAAVKTGMLATSDVIELVTSHADALPNLVVDPVMVAASGDRLLAADAEDAYEELLAAATLVTPNADEADVLTGVDVDDVESAERAGRILVEDHGADAALVKGGHVPGDHVVDTLVVGASGDRPNHDEPSGVGPNHDEPNGDGPSDDGANRTAGDEPAVTTFRHDRVDTDATHGSGCTLSSAIATRLAHGADLRTAVGAGVDLLSRAVRYHVDVGEGPGAVHHLVALRNDASRTPTADLVASVAGTVAASWPERIPERGLGLAGATPHAESPDDVAALVGRPTAVPGADEGNAAVSARPAVAFGADDALASVLLAARERDPAVRFAALVRAPPDELAALSGPTTTVTALVESIDDPSPVAGAALASLSTSDGSPIAVSLGPDDGRAIVLGTAPGDVEERLDALGT